MTFGSPGAVDSLLPVRILDIANPARPRNDSTRTTSWCRRPLPPLTRPRSRIRQCCPLLIRASLIFAKRDIACSMHCQVSASILDKAMPVRLVRILIRHRRSHDVRRRQPPTIPPVFGIKVDPLGEVLMKALPEGFAALSAPAATLPAPPLRAPFPMPIVVPAVAAEVGNA